MFNHLSGAHKMFGDAMNFKLIAFIFLFSQFALGQTLKDKRIKEEMLQRVDLLIEKIQETRSHLSRDESSLACMNIKEMFKILPEHLMSIGTRMNLFDAQIIAMEHETKLFLIYIHQRSNICASGNNGENLDIIETDKRLKSMKKIFDKQKKKIKKSDTSYENLYNYYYEFH